MTLVPTHPREPRPHATARPRLPAGETGRSGRKVAWLGLSDTYPCALSTLGSPWLASKRSYVHVPRVPPRDPYTPCTRWCGWVGTRRVLYRVQGEGCNGWVLLLPTHPAPTLVLPGPNPFPSPRFCVHPGTPGLPGSPSAHPGSSHSDTRLRENRARFRVINPKVSH